MAAGHRVIVYNRTREKTEPLVSLGADVAESAADALASSELAIVVLPDAASTRALLFDDSTAGALSGRVIMNVAHTSPEEILALAAAVRSIFASWVSTRERGAGQSYRLPCPLSWTRRLDPLRPRASSKGGQVPRIRSLTPPPRSRRRAWKRPYGLPERWMAPTSPSLDMRAASRVDRRRRNRRVNPAAPAGP